jgi:hypothetical protein
MQSKGALCFCVSIAVTNSYNLLFYFWADALANNAQIKIMRMKQLQCDGDGIGAN